MSKLDILKKLRAGIVGSGSGSAALAGVPGAAAPAVQIATPLNGTIPVGTPIPGDNVPDDENEDNNENDETAAGLVPPTDGEGDDDEDDTNTENPTMAESTDTNKNTTTPKAGASVAAPPAKAAAKLAELKATFPGDEHREFCCECAEQGLTMIEAKAAFGEKMLAQKSAEAEAAAQRAEAEKMLGGAGKSGSAVTAAPREVGRREIDNGSAKGGGKAPDAAALAMKLRDPVTGKLGPVADVKCFDDAVATYMAAGEKEHAAYRLAQVNHPKLWNTKQEEMALALDERRQRNLENRGR